MSAKSIQIEAKIGGAAGFNFDMVMDLNNLSKGDKLPSHIVTPLLPPLKLDKSINIGAGLSLSFGFGGLTAEIISSGNATGKAAIGAAAAANLEYGIKYSYGSKPPLRFLNNTGFSYTPPYFQLNGVNSATGALLPFVLKKFSVTGFLRSTQDFSINYGAIIGSVGVGFSLSQTGAVTFADGKLSASLKNNIVKVPPINSANPSDDTSPDRELDATWHSLVASIDLSPSQSPRPVYRPGDTIPLSVSYTGFPEAAAVSFFFSIVVPDGQEYMILRHVATTSSTGAGTVSVEYVLPWDELYTSSGLAGSGDFFVNVRSSSLVTRVVSTEAFGIESFTAHDGGVEHNVDASRGFSSDSPYELSWRPELLSFYQRTNGAEFHGFPAQSRAVNIDLVLEVLARNGTHLGTQTYALQRRVVNSGRGLVRIPLNATRAAEGRAYFVVTSVEYSNIKSWSKGYVLSRGRVGAGLGLGLGLGLGGNKGAAGAEAASSSAAQPLQQAELQRQRRELVNIANLVCDYASNQPGAFISGVLNSIVVLGIDIGIPLRPLSIPLGVANAVCMASTGSGVAPGVPLATATPTQAPTAFPPGQSLVCPPGKSFDGTKCSLCSSGFYSLGGVGACSPCSGGTYAPAVGSSTCAPCPAGTYSGAFASACDACRPGYFADSAQPRCGLCQAGTFSQAGSAVCLPCANGLFSLPGSSNCQACS